jgi:hypothetical protein
MAKLTMRFIYVLLIKIHVFVDSRRLLTTPVSPGKTVIILANRAVTALQGSYMSRTLQLRFELIKPLFFLEPMTVNHEFVRSCAGDDFQESGKMLSPDQSMSAAEILFRGK